MNIILYIIVSRFRNVCYEYYIVYIIVIEILFYIIISYSEDKYVTNVITFINIS